jgi:hypothetical protein
LCVDSTCSINIIHRMDSLLDENSLNKLNEAAFDLEEDHFGRQEDPHRQEGQQMESAPFLEDQREQ